MLSPSGTVSEMLRLANEGGSPDIRPAVILNHNINPLRITECTTCIVNNSWASRLKELIDDGWLMFRMQTEFGLTGHSTVAYFAKLKPKE